jgi:hypothetical protein
MKTLPKIQTLMLCLLLIACSEDEPKVKEPPVEEPPVVEEEDDADVFFPLKEDKEWTYVYAYYSGDSTFQDATTITLRVEGDSVVENLTYKRLVDQNDRLVKIIRKEDSKYYGRNHELYGGFRHEFMFLDMDKNPGETWSYLKDEGSTKTEYIVKALHDEYLLGETSFNNVLEIQANYYNLIEENYVLKLSTKHLYAKGLGEIYAYYPNPGADFHEHLNISIIGYHTN